MQHIITITCGGEQLALLPQRAVFWPRLKMLLLADTHFGKSTHLRKEGLAVPQYRANDDLARLISLVQKFKPEIVCFLGDFFHHTENQELDNVSMYLVPLAVKQWWLVEGNHDLYALKALKHSFLTLKGKLLPLEGLLLSHEPAKADIPLINICGHLHPGISINGHARQRLRMPCFYKTEHQLILPAFSTITGLNTQLAEKGALRYGIVNDKVFGPL